MTISNLDALIILDVQNDLCHGGPMGVRSGEAVAGRMTIAAKAFAQRGAKVFATQDWHPADHPSFVSQGGQWPDHCIEDSPGAAFHPALELPPGAAIVRKGARLDAYSGFVDSDLDEQLKARGINRVYVGGLTTDHGILNTVIDALSNGYETYVLTDAIAALNVEPGDADRAMHLMEVNGAILTTIEEALEDG